MFDQARINWECSTEGSERHWFCSFAEHGQHGVLKATFQINKRPHHWGCNRKLNATFRRVSSFQTSSRIEWLCIQQPHSEWGYKWLFCYWYSHASVTIINSFVSAITVQHFSIMSSWHTYFCYCQFHWILSNSRCSQLWMNLCVCTEMLGWSSDKAL